MAKYFAATEIHYGKRLESPDGDPTKRGYEQVVFMPGDVVKGLSKDEMRDLWNAGALVEREESDRADKSSDEGDQTQQPPTE